MKSVVFRFFVLMLTLSMLVAVSSSNHFPAIKTVLPDQKLFYGNASILVVAEPFDSSIEVDILTQNGQRRSIQMPNQDTLFLNELGTFSISFRASLKDILSHYAYTMVCNIMFICLKGGNIPLFSLND